MLRKRSRQVISSTSKQRLSNQIFPFHFPENKITKPSSSFTNSPMIFQSLFTNLNFEAEPTMTSSIIDLNNNKPLSPSSQFSDQEHRGIGLALIDSLVIEESHNPEPKKNQKLVLFGSQLRIKVPTTSPSQIQDPALFFSPNYSPVEFGIKTPRSTNISRNREMGFEIGGLNSSGSSTSLSMEEMELSEDYTCVISHGPIPKMTRIFGDSVVVDGEVRSPAVAAEKRRKEEEDVCDWGDNERLSSSSEEEEEESFLRFCEHCSLELGFGKDIFMYRGEKAFCSQECRYQEMLYDVLDNN